MIVVRRPTPASSTTIINNRDFELLICISETVFQAKILFRKAIRYGVVDEITPSDVPATELYKTADPVTKAFMRRLGEYEFNQYRSKKRDYIRRKKAECVQRRSSNLSQLSISPSSSTVTSRNEAG